MSEHTENRTGVSLIHMFKGVSEQYWCCPESSGCYSIEDATGTAKAIVDSSYWFERIASWSGDYHVCFWIDIVPEDVRLLSWLDVSDKSNWLDNNTWTLIPKHRASNYLSRPVILEDEQQNDLRRRMTEALNGVWSCVQMVTSIDIKKVMVRRIQKTSSYMDNIFRNKDSILHSLSMVNRFGRDLTNKDLKDELTININIIKYLLEDIKEIKKIFVPDTIIPPDRYYKMDGVLM